VTAEDIVAASPAEDADAAFALTADRAGPRRLAEDTEAYGCVTVAAVLEPWMTAALLVPVAVTAAKAATAAPERSTPGPESAAAAAITAPEAWRLAALRDAAAAMAEPPGVN